MLPRNISPIPYDKLAEIFRANAAVRAVFLFGSHRAGTAKAESDLDLGIVLDESRPDPTLEILSQFATVGIEKVDLVPISGRDYFLDFEITKSGEPLFRRETFDVDSFRHSIRKRWYDFRYYTDRRSDQLKAKHGSREVVRRRLDLLLQYLTSLRGLGVDPDFIQDPIKFAAAERFLQLAIEACFDIGEHWIVHDGLGTPESYRAVPQILLERGKLRRELAESWIALAGFRNILVHDYAAIDRARVKEFVGTRLGDLDELARVFAGLL